MFMFVCFSWFFDPCLWFFVLLCVLCVLFACVVDKFDNLLWSLLFLNEIYFKFGAIGLYIMVPITVAQFSIYN